MHKININVLIDLSGTLHIGDSPCAGAVRALHRLCTAAASTSTSGGGVSVGIRFCSNTTKESSKALQERLLRAGFDANDVLPHRITTSLEACKRLCVQQRWKPLLMLTPSAQETFRETNEETTGGGAFFPQPDRLPAQLDERERQALRACDTVVVGLAPALFNAEWLNEAFRILSGEYGGGGEKQLVATHRALYVRPAPDAPLAMGPGAYVAALEAATRRKADDTIVCGKPSTTFLQLCLDSIRAERRNSDVTEERNIIVGDDVEADLGGGAIEMGLERILVQTGKYRSNDEQRSDPKHPVKVFASFADFVEQEFFASGLLEEKA